MITDSRQHIRELGLKRIMHARASKKPREGIRMFQVPVLNFEANDYIDLINWKSSHITEPPVTNYITDDDLKLLIHSTEVPVITYPCFPCHTQAVERCVRAVTESVIAVVGEQARDGFIRSRNAARKIMPVFETKSDYCTG